jgi:hypothetical protein
MTILERLKLELNNKPYFTDEEYTVFLAENGLTSTDTYTKATDQSKLLYSVIDVLEAVSNDIDLMRKVDSEFATVSEASKYLEQRIEKIKNRIYQLPSNETSQITLMFRK